MPHRPPLYVLAVVGLLAVGLGAGLWEPQRLAGPRPGEATALLMTGSLWHEHDLAFDHRDLFRGYRSWPLGPSGVQLVSPTDGVPAFYAEPLGYALAALPFYALCGPRGPLVLNVLLYLAVVAAAAALVPRDGRRGAPWLVGFFALAAAAGWVFRLGPEVLRMACLFLPLAVWWSDAAADRPRRRLVLLAACGALLAVGASHQPLDLVLAAPLTAELAWRRRGRELAALVGAGLLSFATLAGAQQLLTGFWYPPADPEVRQFAGPYPIEGPADLWQRGADDGVSRPGVAQAPPARLLGRRATEALLGRDAGLLPYYPFALLALGLGLVAAGRGGEAGRRRRLLLAALATWAVVAWLLAPPAPASGLGSPLFAGLYPALFLLPGRPPGRGALALPVLAAGAWTVVALVASLAPGLVASATPSFGLLPAELSRLATAPPGQAGLPGYVVRRWGEAVYLLPEASFFADEPHPHGVWMRGASCGELFVILPDATPTLEFTVRALAAENTATLDGGGERWRVPFDSPAKRRGVEVALPVTPVARDLGAFFPQEVVYRIRACSSDGLVPARRDPASRDRRYLGTFLDFTGEGL